MMQEAMKGMSKEDQEEMKKMMKSVQPAMDKMMNSTADYPEFTENLQLVPAKNQSKITGIEKKIFSPAALQQNTLALYTKLMINAPAEEKKIVNQVVTKHKKADVLMAAASTAFLMGHRAAAAGLAMKAVMIDGKNIVYQNNLAAILTQTGYPEKAIPYLNTLRAVKPGNSTLNNNLGYAWFYLGELDSASKYIQLALRRNPAHAEAQLCAGVIAEAHGDEPSAIHAYEEAFTETASHLPANMLRNKNKTNPSALVDYQRLIHSITIFEYFDSNWSKLPVITNEVTAWEKNTATLKGLDTMHEKISKEIEGFKKEAEKEIEALLDNDKTPDGDKFVAEMMTANLEGLNMMSKPALYILAILTEEYKRMVTEMQDSALAVQRFVDYQRDLKSKVAPDAKCPVFDRKSNEFMQAVNPRMHKLWKRNLEKFRVWLNVWCTWRWFITGNVKNTVTVELLEWELGFLDLRRSAFRTFVVESQHCKTVDEPTAIEAEDLLYYYTDCIPEVKLPFSISTLEASANAAKMDNNAFGIKYSGQPIPNASFTFGISGTVLSEPGLYGNPGMKTSEGGITPQGINYADANDDDELIPLPKLPPASEDDLTPLPRIFKEPLDELNPLPKIPKAPLDDLVPLDKGLLLSPADKKALAQAHIARLSLNKKLKRNCINVGTGKLEVITPKIVVGEGELIFEESMIYEEKTGQWGKQKGKIVVGEGELIFEELPTGSDKTEPSKLQTIINNGMEILKTTAKSVANLFK
ncbi:MAG: hypothetical protein EAZ17_05860 [Sphingobacteriales bacterium]|nr:MAG: hypothetical protein EAZ17_05860 [Sphingobacteriales bacterium]